MGSVGFFFRSKKNGLSRKYPNIWSVTRIGGYKKGVPGYHSVPFENTSALTTTRGQAVIEGIAQGLGGLEDLRMTRRQAVVGSLSHQLQTGVPHHVWVGGNTAFASTCLTGLRKTSWVSLAAGYRITSFVALQVKQVQKSTVSNSEQYMVLQYITTHNNTLIISLIIITRYYNLYVTSLCKSNAIT